MTSAASSHTRLYATSFAVDGLRDAREASTKAEVLQKLNTAAHNIASSIEVEVREWREQGATWADVGTALGITRQAAQQRFRESDYFNA